MAAHDDQLSSDTASSLAWKRHGHRPSVSLFGSATAAAKPFRQSGAYSSTRCQRHPLAASGSSSIRNDRLQRKPLVIRKPAFTSDFPNALGSVPTIQQNMGQCARHRLKSADDVGHHVDFAGKRNPFDFTNSLLPIHPGCQRTTSAQQHIQPLHQTMPGHRFLFRARVVAAQTAHFLAAPLRHCRVIPDQVTCHNGFLRSTSFLLAPTTQSGMFSGTWAVISCRNWLCHCRAKSSACHGACPIKRLAPERLTPLLTCRNSPDSVRPLWHNINPRSMVTKYLYWGWLKQPEN